METGSFTDIEIKCPHCGEAIRLSETLAATQLEGVRNEYERKIDEARASAEEAAMARAKKKFEAEAEERAQKMRDMEEQNAIIQKKLEEAQADQAKSLKRERELEAREKALELEVQKRVNAELSEERAKVVKSAQDEIEERYRERLEKMALDSAEKDKRLADTQRRLEETTEKLNSKSQQLQGEVLELKLEDKLRQTFPTDEISEVKKGHRGADVIQDVHDHIGSTCGRIVWESKRTSKWDAKWIAKLRQDQRDAQGDLAVLMSVALPQDVESFCEMDGVWVCSPRYAIPLAHVLRASLIKIAETKSFADGAKTKAERLYDYIRSTSFRSRIEGILEAYRTMQKDLEAEKTAYANIWKKREMQIRSVMDQLAGMYGDVQGIAGAAVKEIESMTLEAIGSGDE